MSAPPRYRELEEEIDKVRADKEAAIEAQEFEKAAQLRDKERKLSQKKKELEEEWRNQADEEQPEIGEDEIADIVSMWTGIPVFKLTEAESQKLIRMEDELHKRVIGQHQAIVAVSKAIRRARAGIKDPKRPTGSFIFLGPSGVGKTELARTLAEFLFGDEDAMIQVDMSEYMEKHSVSRLVGSPPGYVGYDEGGQLTEAVRRKPYSVLLLDEIEKAHPDVFNILLQILEDGKLTDSQGRKVDFRNTIVIMTSNLGAAQISKNQTLGFSIGDEQGLSYDEMKERVMSELKKVFRPELLNRIDEVIVFHKLEKREILEVVDLMMKRVREEMAKHGVVIELTDEARELLVEQGYDPAMGARPLRRAIQRMIEDPLADFILGRELTPATTIVVDRRENPVEGEPPVEIRVIEGTPVPAAVGAPEDERRRRRGRAGRRGRLAARAARASRRPLPAGRRLVPRRAPWRGARSCSRSRGCQVGPTTGVGSRSYVKFEICARGDEPREHDADVARPRGVAVAEVLQHREGEDEDAEPEHDAAPAGVEGEPVVELPSDHEDHDEQRSQADEQAPDVPSVQALRDRPVLAEVHRHRLPGEEEVDEQQAARGEEQLRPGAESGDRLHQRGRQSGSLARSFACCWSAARSNARS